MTTDKSEQFRELPVIRGLLADPMKTSRKTEDLYNQLTRAPDTTQITQAIDKVRISNDAFSEVISDAILNNQRDYRDMWSNFEDLDDTLADIWLDIQIWMDGMIDEMQWVKKQMKIKNQIAMKRVKQNEETNEYLDSIDQWIDDTRRWIDQTNMSIEDMKNEISYDFSRTQNYLWSIESSAKRNTEASYGARIPETRSIDELMENADFEWKKTLLALFAKEWVDNGNDSTSPRHHVFSSSFGMYLGKNITSEEARQICEEKKGVMIGLEEEYIQQHNILKKEKRTDDRIFEELTPLRDKISEISRWLIPDEEIELLDFYQEAKTAENIADLINMWLLDDTTLEKLVRHHKVDGEVVLELSHMLKMDENGINPMLNLDGDVGRLWQLRAQTLQWNIALRQRQEIVKDIKEWNELTKITNQNLENIDYSINTWFEQTNQNLENIDGHIQEINSQLWYANEQLEDVNDNLSIIDDHIQETNMILEEGNQLSRITGQILLGIHSQIATTWYQITQALENIWGAIVVGFNQTLGVLSNIQEINGEILQTNQEILQELYKQSEILLSIDQRLAKPLDTQANECFMYGIEMLGVEKRPSKSDWTVALESFENGLKLRNTHLLNLYGAWTALRNLWEDKRAAAYLERAYKFANKANNISLSKTIAMDLAKVYTKYLKLKVAKHRLDEVITHDKENIEAYLLKARITNILEQKDEFKTLLNSIYRKIIEEGKGFTLTTSYDDILKYFFKPTTDFVDKHIQKWILSRLLKILPSLQSIWHQDAVKTIVWHTLFQYPHKVKSSEVDIKKILNADKEFFTERYQEFINKKIVWVISDDYFMAAYIGYKTMDFEQIKAVLDIGLKYDADYIRFKNTSDTNQKKAYKENLVKRIYALGDEAKYMLRDYLQQNPESLLYI